jgi:SAM-dependent methyltransferase
MKVADFGCGVGAVTRMLADMVGPSGSVTGIDVNAAQLEQAEALCLGQGLANTAFVAASADDTGLARNSYDLVYCRFLLLHLVDPAACLREMRALLRPGGILVVEDGDLASATAAPTALDALPISSVDSGRCAVSTSRSHGGSSAGDGCRLHCSAAERISPPSNATNRVFTKWSVEEAGPSFVGAGIISSDCLEQPFRDAGRDRSDVRILARMSLVWARK